jgi:Lectin C-type domain
MRVICLALLSSVVACGNNGDDAVDHIPDGGGSTTVLTKTTPEPAGSNCQYGGTEVQVGIDTNGNGILDADEVTSTFYICDPAPSNPMSSVYYGELVIGSAGDVAAAQSYTGVIGDVIISEDSDVTALDVALPNLMFISGAITDCQGGDEEGDVAPARRQPAVSATATVSLAALQVVGGIDIECGSPISSLAFPALTSVNGSIFLNNSSLATWSAPVLASIAESIDVFNTSLTTLTLPPPGNTVDASLDIENNALFPDCAADDLAGAIRRAGFRGSIYVGGNGDGSGNSGAFCTDPTHACQSVTIDSDSTDWRECWTTTDFDAGRAMCQGLGMGWDLAYFTSIADEESVGALAYQSTYWIGYYQATESAPYTWVQAPQNQTFAPQSSSDPMYGAFWNTGEPTGDANPDCVETFSTDVYNPTAVVANDTVCDDNFAPLCRYLP